MFFNVRQHDSSSKPHFARKGLAKIEIAREKKNHQDRNIIKKLILCSVETDRNNIAHENKA